MPCIVTTIHDPIALATTCRRSHLPAPQQGTTHLDVEVHGWVVYLPGLRHAVVFNTLTGLAAYHPDDNAFHRYGHIMRFIYRVYEMQARLRRDRQPSLVA